MPLICQSVVEHINALCVVYISYDTHEGLLTSDISQIVDTVRNARFAMRVIVMSGFTHLPSRIHDASESIRVRRGYALKDQHAAKCC